MFHESYRNRGRDVPLFVIAVALIFLVVAAGSVGTAAAGPLVASGGGFLGGGIKGQYYVDHAGRHFAGKPVFSRRDVRIDFNWGPHSSFYTVAGSNTYRLPDRHFSVSWRGRLMTRYSQTYQFSVTSAGGGARVEIKPAGTKTWTMLADAWTAHHLQRNHKSLPLIAGKVYDFRAQYYHRSGAARMQVRWVCPLTRRRAIGPVERVGVNGSTPIDWDPGLMFADVIKTCRIGQLSPHLSAHGWPIGNASFVLFTLPANAAGTYTLTFKGRAKATIAWIKNRVISSHYDAVDNTTTEIIRCGAGHKAELVLQHTRRLPTDHHATGVTDIRLMRPIAIGAHTSYPPTTTFTTPYKTLLRKFTAIRFMDFLGMNSPQGFNGGNALVHWSRRLRPSFSSQTGVHYAYQGAGGALEYAVELCNETGKDMWMNIPMPADNGYLHKLALALKYGFDAHGNPYTSRQVDPAWPPLNSNLRVYLEYSNEVWNGGFYQHNLCSQLALRAVKDHSRNGLILSYDHTTNPTLLGQRWWILRTKEISDAFRQVWGNAAMMRVVRPVFEFQYGNYNNTADLTLQFLANYFNNEDGHHVAHPHPLNYYLYAAGGGWYNTVNNNSGLGAVKISNRHFQMPVVAANTVQTAPVHANWRFSGAAGLVGANPSATSAAVATHLGSLLKSSQKGNQGVGYRFTVGNHNLDLQSIGYYVAKGDWATHVIFLLNSHRKLMLRSVGIATAHQPVGHYAYANVGPVELKAHHHYYLISLICSWTRRDSYYGPNTTLQTTPDIRVDCAESAVMPKAYWLSRQWVFHRGPSGHVAGPINFTYVLAPSAKAMPPRPQAVYGAQAAYLQSGGSLSQKIDMPAGVCDVQVLASSSTAAKDDFQVRIGRHILHGGWPPNITPEAGAYQWYTVGPADIRVAGVHKFELIKGSGQGTIFINAVRVVTTAPIIASGLKNTTPVWRTEADWARAYGLRTAGYEGGFEIGGDSPNGVTMAANVAPRVKRFTAETLQDYLSAGGNVPIVFCVSGGAYSVVMSSPLGIPNIFCQHTPKLAGYRQVMAHLPPPVSNGILIPTVLTPANATLAYDNPPHETWTYTDPSGVLKRMGGWMSWNILVAAGGMYHVAATAATTGRYELLVDSVPIAQGGAGASAAGSIRLTPGLHAVKVRNLGNVAVTVRQISVTQVGAPAAPRLRSVIVSPHTAQLRWSAVPGASGYIIAWGAAPGAMTHFVDAGVAVSKTISSGINLARVHYFGVLAYGPARQRGMTSNIIRAVWFASSPLQDLKFGSLRVGTRFRQVQLHGFNIFGWGGGDFLQVQGKTQPRKQQVWPGGWPETMLFSMTWGHNFGIVQADGKPLTMHSMDVAVNYGHEQDSCIVRGYDPDGICAFQKVVAFAIPQKRQAACVHLSLHWIDVSRVDVIWTTGRHGTGRGRFGAIGRIVVGGGSDVFH